MTPAEQTSMAPYRIGILWLISSAAWAGVEPAPATPDRTGSVVRSARPEPPVPSPRKATPGATLRCWQYGQLLFEEPISTIPATLSAQTHVFEGKPGGPPVQLIEMQSSICMVR